MTTFQIYTALFITTTLYAALLAWLRHLWEPDLTFLEVMIGVAICLGAAHLDLVSNGPMTSELYESRVWLAFKVGGTPIVIWQLWQLVSAQRQIWLGIRGVHDDTTRHTPDPATTVATQRGQHSKTRDRAG